MWAHIVVADEKPELLEMMVHALRSADHCVFQANDGMAAFQLTLGLAYIDLLITDTEMPGFDGVELIRHLRSQLPTLPILHIQNLGQSVDWERLPPDVPTLREPFSPDQLIDAVRALLVQRECTASASL